MFNCKQIASRFDLDYEELKYFMISNKIIENEESPILEDDASAICKVYMGVRQGTIKSDEVMKAIEAAKNGRLNSVVIEKSVSQKLVDITSKLFMLDMIVGVILIFIFVLGMIGSYTPFLFFFSAIGTGLLLAVIYASTLFVKVIAQMGDDLSKIRKMMEEKK